MWGQYQVVSVESIMTEQIRPRVKYVIGPDGSPLTINDLPPATTRRWVIRRKAEVVAAVRGGLLSLDEACARYTLTVEEYLSWQASIEEKRSCRFAHNTYPAISPLGRSVFEHLSVLICQQLQIQNPRIVQSSCVSLAHFRSNAVVGNR